MTWLGEPTNRIPYHALLVGCKGGPPQRLARRAAASKRGLRIADPTATSIGVRRFPRLTPKNTEERQLIASCAQIWEMVPLLELGIDRAQRLACGI